MRNSAKHISKNSIILGNWITTRSSFFIPKFSKPEAKRSTFLSSSLYVICVLLLTTAIDPHIFQHVLLTSNQMFLQANTLLLDSDWQILLAIPYNLLTFFLPPIFHSANYLLTLKPSALFGT